MRLGSTECVSFTVHAAIHLEVVVAKVSLAVCTGQATRVKFLLALAFEVLAFNASVAGCTDAAIKFVIVAFAVR